MLYGFMQSPEYHNTSHYQLSMTFNMAMGTTFNVYSCHYQYIMPSPWSNNRSYDPLINCLVTSAICSNIASPKLLNDPPSIAAFNPFHSFDLPPCSHCAIMVTGGKAAASCHIPMTLMTQHPSSPVQESLLNTLPPSLLLLTKA